MNSTINLTYLCIAPSLNIMQEALASNLADPWL